MVTLYDVGARHLAFRRGHTFLAKSDHLAFAQVASTNVIKLCSGSLHVNA
jgi:hypothetical protein